MIRPHRRHHRLDHGLEPYLPHFAQLRSRRALARDPIYRRLRAEVDQVLAGFEWDLREVSAAAPAPAFTRLRAVAWNIERGKRFDALMGVITQDPAFTQADLLLLTELDIGMARSGNRNIPRAIAEALGLGYVFANYHLVLAPGDKCERDLRGKNGLSLHGAALFTRYPVRGFQAVALPEFTDKFYVEEKRLGTKRALLCELELPDGPALVVVVHLDPFAPPRHRALQLKIILDAVERTGISRVLLGGDFNTNTFHLGSKLGLAVDVAHKWVRYGFYGAINHYMSPEQVYERRVFESMHAAGLTTEGFTDRETGTIYYDLGDTELQHKSMDYLPGFLLRWLERKLQSIGGPVPMRVDHFAARGFRPLHAATLARARHGDDHVSDHSPILVDVAGGQ